MLQDSDRWDIIKQNARSQALILGGFIVLIWFLEVVDFIIFRGALDAFGIRPRTISGLAGIFLAPLLHGGFGHVAANTFPLLILGWLILSTRRLSRFTAITITIIVIGGLGTWLIGPRFSVHLGASGLIFGYFGFLLAIAYFERSVAAFALAVVVIFLYGGMIFGILPRGDGVSWQSHLFGFIGGALAAYLLGKTNDLE